MASATQARGREPNAAELYAILSDAYAADGHVLFSVTSDPGYGALMNYEGQFDRMPPVLNEMIAGYRRQIMAAFDELVKQGGTYSRLYDAWLSATAAT